MVVTQRQTPSRQEAKIGAARTEWESDVGRVEALAELRHLGRDSVDGVIRVLLLSYGDRESQRVRVRVGRLNPSSLTSRQNRFPGGGDEEGVPVVRNVEDEEDDLEQFERLGKV